VTADDTRPDLPGGHGHAQGRRGPSSPGAGDLPAPARRAAEAAYRNWRIGDDGEGRLHAALVVAASLIRADERERPGAIPLSETLTDEQVAEFRERFEAAVANPGLPRVLPSDGWLERAEAAEAKLAEVRETIAAFFTHHGNSAAFALRSARDLAEGVRQVLDRAPLEAPEAAAEATP
jgi:hypothetical protein